MSQNITDVDAFTSPVAVPVNGEAATDTSVLTPFQALANRCRYLLNKLTGTNVGIGAAALESIDTGTTNVAIGEDAGTSVTTGSGNVLLGSNTGTPAADTDDFLDLAGLLFGDRAGGVVRIGLDKYTAVVADADEVLQLDGDLMFLDSVTSPDVYQAGTDGNDLTIRAQAGGEADGGDLILLGGDGGASDDGNVRIASASGGVGFFAAAGATKQTVSGSTVDGTALQSLLDALVAYGLITDVTNDS